MSAASRKASVDQRAELVDGMDEMVRGHDRDERLGVLRHHVRQGQEHARARVAPAGLLDDPARDVEPARLLDVAAMVGGDDRLDARRGTTPRARSTVCSSLVRRPEYAQYCLGRGW